MTVMLSIKSSGVDEAVNAVPKHQVRLKVLQLRRRFLYISSRFIRPNWYYFSNSDRSSDEIHLPRVRVSVGRKPWPFSSLA